MLMKAMILAAGLGTRLRPLTNSIPKALVEVNGKPLLQHALEHLKQFEITEVIVNVHHFAGMIMEFLEANDNFGLKISVSDESDELLETGGGVKKAEWFLRNREPFLVRNVDVLSDLDLLQMLLFHRENSPLATLAVRNRESSRYFLFDDRDRLSGWENRKSGETKISRPGIQLHAMAFSGIQILQPEIFTLMPEYRRFSLTDVYIQLAANYAILGYPEKNALWKDIGRREQTHH